MKKKRLAFLHRGMTKMVIMTQYQGGRGDLFHYQKSPIAPFDKEDIKQRQTFLFCHCEEGRSPTWQSQRLPRTLRVLAMTITLDSPVSGTGQAYQVRHDNWRA